MREAGNPLPGLLPVWMLFFAALLLLVVAILTRLYPPPESTPEVMPPVAPRERLTYTHERLERRRQRSRPDGSLIGSRQAKPVFRDARGVHMRRTKAADGGVELIVDPFPEEGDR